MRKDMMRDFVVRLPAEEERAKKLDPRYGPDGKATVGQKTAEQRDRERQLAARAAKEEAERAQQAQQLGKVEQVEQAQA